MANHKSAKKRSKQTLKKKQVNVRYLSKIRTALNNFEASIKSKNQEDISKSFAEVNSSMSKALKRGIIKKHLLSRKLSSLSKQIKNI
tara:strand:+ start:440 stop:700 length:261 start_codon:yes stop_codon:yes gene_type:complete